MDSGLTSYVFKNSGKRDSRLKYDFMPSLLEIIERPSHVAGTVILLSIVALLAAAMIWANFSELDVVVSAAGNVAPDGKVVGVHALIGGRVDAVCAREGDYVSAGDAILSIENGTAIDLARLEYDMEWCMTRRSVAEGCLDSDDYEIPFSQHDGKFHAGLEQMALEIGIYRTQMAHYQEDLDRARADLLDAESKRMDALAISALQGSVKSLEDNMELGTMNYRAYLHGLVFSLDREMEELNAQAEKMAELSETYIVRSPVDGHVNMVSASSAGQVVTAGSLVASVVPSGSPLVVECYLPDASRSEIGVGMECKVKLRAYPFSDYGEIAGKVGYISPSTFSSEAYGNVYAVTVEVDMESLDPNIELTSGLSGSVEILVGRRTVMRYFLDPILGSLRESLKEN